MVRRGSEVQILERGVPIARLVGLEGASARGEAERVEQLERAGILRRGTSDLSWLAVEPPLLASAVDLSGAVDEDREDRF